MDNNNKKEEIELRWSMDFKKKIQFNATKFKKGKRSLESFFKNKCNNMENGELEIVWIR